MIYVIIIFIICLLYFFIGWNHKIDLQHYQIASDKIKKHVRIVHLSDLHSCLYGEEQQYLLHAIQKEQPDIIMMTGDMFDERGKDQNVLRLLNELVTMYPCYFVSGNHEYKAGVNRVKQLIKETGVIILENESVILEPYHVCICGVDDPYLKIKNYGDCLYEAFVDIDSSLYTVLLAHRPERIHTHLRYPCDLILSGHAHGGQWRIPPLLNGMYAPQQGIFPKYAGGLYKYDHQIHIVNRGLAKHIKIPRIYNRPEVVVIDIVTK